MEISWDDLEKIWHDHDLGTIESLACPRLGSMNYTLIVNGEFLIRFRVHSKGRYRFQTESIVSRLLSTVDGLNGPEVVAFDDSLHLFPHEYLIMKCMQGVSVTSVWDSFATLEKRELGVEIGMALAKIHSVELSAFGDLPEEGLNAFDHWIDYVEDYLKECDARASGIESVDSVWLERVGKVIFEHRGLIEDVQTACLLHGDFDMSNLLVNGHSLSGVIDFEWALGGDPAWDFYVEDRWDSKCDGMRDLLLLGYEKIKPFDRSFRLRIQVYTLLRRLEHFIDASARESFDEARRVEYSLGELFETF